jgi:hypothetical protein
MTLLSGCIGGQSSETRLYSLPSGGSRETLPCRVTVLKLRHLSGAASRFLFRFARNRMQTDEFNRWLLDPELSLERFLRGALKGSGKEDIRVRGVITAFEFDAEKHLAVLAVDFTLYNDTLDETFSIRQEKSFTEKENAAEAMGQCAVSLAAELRSRILALYKQTQTNGAAR